jgi:Uma2 family endonuclease
MRAVIVHVTEAELAHRRTTGLDRWDEMWDGVLHMTPAPGLEHQRMLGRLIGFLEAHLRTTGRGQVFAGINVFREAMDYRIPDLTFVAAGRERLLHQDGVRGGGPDAVIEIHSPHDESYEKLPFYAALGTREVVVIDRDRKRPEVHRLVGSEYLVVSPDADGWLRSEAMNVRFRLVQGQPPRLSIEDAVDPAITTVI